MASSVYAVLALGFLYIILTGGGSFASRDALVVLVVLFIFVFVPVMAAWRLRQTAKPWIVAALTLVPVAAACLFCTGLQLFMAVVAFTVGNTPWP